MESRVLFIHGKEIRRMNIGWRFYHLFKEPPHKYRGKITLGKDALMLKGMDIKRDEEFGIEIPCEKIEDLLFGFDDVFKRRMSILKPLRIRYQTDGERSTVYLFIDFRKAVFLFSLRAWVIPKTKNKDWLFALRKKLAIAL